MDVRQFSRHQLRAQGRLNRTGLHPHLPTKAPIQAVRTNLKDASGSGAPLDVENYDLLEFLSRSVTEYENNLLNTDWQLNSQGEDKEPAPSFVAYENVSQPIAVTDSNAKEKLSEPESTQTQATAFERACLPELPAKALGGMWKELNDWLSASGMAAGNKPEKISQTERDLLHLSNASEQGHKSFEEAVAVDKAKRVITGLSSLMRGHRFVSPLPPKSEGIKRRNIRRQLTHQQHPFTAVQATNGEVGRRLESYESGAELEKDQLGRVVSMRSGDGTNISVRYDKDGYPESFVRSCKGGAQHSIAMRDQLGVVVLDREGRVRAAGESLAVDPRGTLSICRADGQFWSLDLVQSLHIERRRIADNRGDWHLLTAVFASDGFRMMTLFQKIGQTKLNPTKVKAHDDKEKAQNQAISCLYRFYGRDGSVVQFESEDQLTDSRPSRVWPPGSRQPEPIDSDSHQARTAWQSVQEYVSSYLLPES